MPFIPIIIGLVLALGAGPLFTVVGSLLLFQIMVGVGLSMVLSGVSTLLTPHPKAAALTSTGNAVTVRQPISSWRVVYGTQRLGGIITYIETTGTNNEFLHLVITLAGHQVHAIGTMYFDGVAATEDGTFVFVERNLGTDTQAAFSDLVAKSAGKWTSVYQQKGRAGVHVRLKWDQTKFPNGVPNITFDVSGKELYDPRTLATAFSANAALALADYLTDANYGLAVKTRKATRLQSSGGSVLLKRFVTTGTSVNNQAYEGLVFVENIGAKDVEVHDNFGHLVTVPAGTKQNVYLTWKGDGSTSNELLFYAKVASDALDLLVYTPVLRRSGIEENQIVDVQFTGSTWATGTGATITTTQNHLASLELDRLQLIAAANTCDEDVALKAGGTEKRYTCNGSFDTSTATGENIQSLLTAMAGRLTYTNAIFNIFPGAYLTPTETINEGDLRDTLSVQTTRSKRDLFNGVKGLFISPVNNWQATDFPPYQNLSYVTHDGEELWKDVQLPFTTSVKTAQRLAKIDLERIRRQVTVVFKCKLSKWTIGPLDTIQVNNSRFGWVNKTFEVLSSTLAFESQDKAGYIVGVDIVAVETDANVYAWNAATEEGMGEVTGSPTLPSHAVSPVTAVTLASGDTNSLVVDGVRYARLLVSWTLPADQFVLSGGYHDVYYRVVGSGTWVHHGRFDGSIAAVLIGNVAVGSSYEAFVRSTNVNGSTADSATSSPHTVTITLAGSVTGAYSRPYRPLSNPLTGHDAGSNATVNVAGFTTRVQGLGDVVYNSGSITGLAYNTLYYITYDDATAVGGTVSFTARTTKEDALGAAGRFFLGSIQTPKAGFIDTVGNNDGGSGAQFGNLTILNFSQTNFNNVGNGTTTDPQKSLDNDQTTFTKLNVTGNNGNNSATHILAVAPGQVFRPGTITLKALVAVPTNTLNGSGDVFKVAWAADGNSPFFAGTTFHTIAPGVTEGVTLISATLPLGTNVSALQVGFGANCAAFNQSTGALEAHIIDAWVEVVG